MKPERLKTDMVEKEGDGGDEKTTSEVKKETFEVKKETFEMKKEASKMKKMMMEITKATPEDIGALTAVFVEVFNQGDWKQNWSEESARECLSNIFQFPHFYGLIAKLEGEAVGALLGHIQTFDKSRTFYIDELFVSPKYRKKGIAKALYRQGIEELKFRGVNGSFFTTLRNSQAYNFYVSQGAIDLTDSAVFYHPF